jgi:hypothetical protein
LESDDAAAFCAASGMGSVDANGNTVCLTELSQVLTNCGTLDSADLSLSVLGSPGAHGRGGSYCRKTYLLYQITISHHTLVHGAILRRLFSA